MTRALAFCLSLAMAAASAADSDAVAEFSSSYSLSNSLLQFGVTQRSLRRNSDGSYTLLSSTTPVGALEWLLDGNISERSDFDYTGDGDIQSRHYSYNKVHGSKERREELNFDWGKKQATSSGDAKPRTLDLVPGTLDKHIYQLAIMNDLRRKRSVFNYPVADGSKIKSYEFKILGQETVTAPPGKFATVKLARVGDKRQAVFWCAPELGFVPVRIEYTEKNGDRFFAELLTFNDKSTRQEMLQTVKP